jgi:hypothetical protein
MPDVATLDPVPRHQTRDPIFTRWEPKYASVWGTQPLCLEHRLHQSPLFTRQALAELIERVRNSPDNYMLVHMGAQGDRKLWRLGQLDDTPGMQVIEAVAAGRLWINLMHVNDVDKRYSDLLDEAYEEVAERVPGYITFNRFNGILISSPRAQVYYHFDPAGQSLWQIEGTKRVYVYPPVAPFLMPEALELVALYRDEVSSIKYEPWFDEYATVYDLQPGQMLHWPLNSPHRIENMDVLNISMTAEYFTQEIRRQNMVSMANGLLRQKLGMHPDRSIRGAGFWSKAAFQAVVRRSGLLEGERTQRRAPTFKLDPARPGQIIDLPT